MVTAIVNARIFDGDRVVEARSVVLDGERILAVGAAVPVGAEVVDASGGMLLPGLIDGHVHTDEAALAMALRFGITTELEMQGTNTRNDRAHISDDDTLADVRSSGFAVTPPGGHPEELFPPDFRPGGGPGAKRPRVDPIVRPHVTNPAEAVAFVGRLAAAGSDYVKFMVDDGSVEGHPGIPMLDEETLRAGVAEAKRRGLLTVAHALTLEATRTCLDAGVDGVAHLFLDAPPTEEIVQAFVRSGAFVVACVVLNASMMGITGAELADDPRVSSRLDPAWETTLRSSFGHYPDGRLDNVYASVNMLHAAGVDILVGTDVSQPLPFLGGLAHGASVHHELQHLVRAGLTPVEALRAATATTARRFGLDDRGRIATGLRADLLLVDGDPTTTISDTLNTRAVWRRGTRLAV